MRFRRRPRIRRRGLTGLSGRSRALFADTNDLAVSRLVGAPRGDRRAVRAGYLNQITALAHGGAVRCPGLPGRSVMTSPIATSDFSILSAAMRYSCPMILVSPHILPVFAAERICCSRLRPE